MVEEYRAWIRPWGFTLDDVKTPAAIWQGSADELVPPAFATQLVDGIPTATLTSLPGEGHFLAYRHRREILQALVG